MRQRAYNRYVLGRGDDSEIASVRESAPTALIGAKNLLVAPHLAHLYAYLLENRCIEPLSGFDESMLDIFSRDVLKKIQQGDSSWETMVPMKVAEIIKQRGLFGYLGEAQAA
jgi:hypothetical protein